MKNRKVYRLFFFCAVLTGLFFSCSDNEKYKNDTHKAVLDGKTVVERYGHLQVNGTDLCSQDGQPVQLHGMSSHGLHWYGKYANKDVIKWLRDDWNCQLWRPALYTQGAYIGNPVLKQKVIDSIEACIDCGMYVLVDWHVLADKDPLLYADYAAEFFDEISKKYGDRPNIIYEICNEPNGKDVTWKENIKPYAERIIEVIRKNDPDNIIVIGTPNWSGDVLSAANDPVLNQKNVMYTIHFYAGSHKSERRKQVKSALKKGIPVFATEWGCTKESGDGGVFEKETLEWIEFMKKNNISWVNWSVNNKGEDSGILVYNADREAKGNWKDKDLSKAGKFIRKIMRGELDLKTYKPEKK